MTEVRLSLPDELVRQARQAGLLNADTVAELLRDAMRERRIDQLFSTIKKLQALEPALTEAEVQAEVQAARKARRQPNADRH